MIADPRSMAGKNLPVDEQVELLVIGGGPAGLAAAREAASIGLQVVLAEEHPIAAETMGLDVPLQFGGRASGAVRNRNAALEAVLESDPAIAEAFEAGIDVRLGAAVWGLWSNGPAVQWLPGLVAGLMTDGTATMLRAERVIVATGRRDMALAFPGWDRPGVMGAVAAEQLLTRYGALAARRVVVLGSSPEAVATCRTLASAGIEIAAIVEQAASPIDPSATALGTPLLLSHAPRSAEGGAELQSLVVGAVDDRGRAIAGTEREIACDTVLLAIGAVPLIELLDAAGAAIRFDPALGGHLPVLDAEGQTTVAGVFAAGDCTGIATAKSRERWVAEAEGRRAARAVARSLGREAPAEPAEPVPTDLRDHAAERLGWVRACVVETSGGDGPTVCQCEEVSARDVMEVRPPRYLGWEGNGRNAVRDLRGLIGAGAPDQDQVKRLTRAGMGLCQGRRCREQVAALLALSAGADLADVKLASHRAPVRPIPLAAAADAAEPAALTEQWDTWFGMATQYLPPWEVQPHYTAGGRTRTGAGEVSSE